MEDVRITAKDKFLPCLLDRLTDSNPHMKDDSNRPLSPQQLKRMVARDLANLLNAKARLSREEEASMPDVASSVLNFGLEDFCGRYFTAANAQDLEKGIRKAIVRFEPRIAPESLRVTLSRHAQDAPGLNLGVEIEGVLKVVPMTDELLIKMQFDLDSGRFQM